MDLRTYRAKSIQDALRLVRQELGPDAAVLHTREVRPGLLGWLGAGTQVEVVASRDVALPSRLPKVESQAEPANVHDADVGESLSIPPAHELDFRSKFRQDLEHQLHDLHGMLEDLCRGDSGRRGVSPLPVSSVRNGNEAYVLQELLDAQFNEEIAREYLDRLRHSLSAIDWEDLTLIQSRLLRLVENEIPVQGPIRISPHERRIVALVGPTGVGKTTTIAKLAARFHLQQKQRVGLVTVDTYRIAAVEQLRTYAEIIDLPMEVVSTPRDMRGAMNRLADCDLILMDTAGRSPRDEVKVRELKSILAEAKPHEVHLVLSCVASESSILQTAERFAEVGANGLVLTKLDEATGLGPFLPLFRQLQLPLSYVTCGQDVPNDLEAADRRRLARRMLRWEEPPAGLERA